MDVAPKSPPVLPDSIRRNVLSKVAPTASERKEVLATVKGLLKAAEEAVATLGAVGVEPVIAGSVAKGTYSRSPDIDIFLLFPKDTTDRTLERMGLAIGAKVLTDPVRKYTQHPYTTGTFKGFQCDLVPCLKVDRGEKVRTAVDRTPHHVDYINSTLRPEQRDDVLLLKSFLKGIGAYGAEDTVRGFSGYLVELMVISFGSFDGTIRALSRIETLKTPFPCAEEVSDLLWLPEGPVIFEVLGPGKEHGPPSTVPMAERFPREPLVVVDPVDPRRNVASPVSAQTLAHTVTCASALVENPSQWMFHPFSGRPFDLDAVKLDSNEVSPSLGPLVVGVPGGNSSIAATQLRRSINTCISSLKREGFRSVSVKVCAVFPKGRPIDQGFARARWCLVSKRSSVPLFALGISTDPLELDVAKEHWGPPHDSPRAQDFMDKWGDRVLKDNASGRLYTIVQRPFTNPIYLFSDSWAQNARGIFEGSALVTLEDSNLRAALVSVLNGGRS